MAQLLVIVKILPTDTEVDLDELVKKIKASIKDDIKLRNYSKTMIQSNFATIIHIWV